MTTDPSGTQEYFRGGPNGPIEKGCGRGLGSVLAEYGPYVPGARDYEPWFEPTEVIADDGLPCAPYNNVLHALGDEINAAQIPTGHLDRTVTRQREPGLRHSGLSAIAHMRGRFLGGMSHCRWRIGDAEPWS